MTKEINRPGIVKESIEFEIEQNGAVTIAHFLEANLLGQVKLSREEAKEFSRFLKESDVIIEEEFDHQGFDHWQREGKY